jgi:uncharacterized protein YqeY
MTERCGGAIMSLREDIEASFKKALTEHNELELGLFRLIKSAIKNVEIDAGHELTDDEIMAVLEKQAKQRKDSISQFEEAGRTELAEHEKAELAIIEKFLPEKMGEEEIRAVVKTKVAENEGADFGRVMGAVMGELKGKADGATVQRILKEEMSS